MSKARRYDALARKFSAMLATTSLSNACDAVAKRAFPKAATQALSAVANVLNISSLNEARSDRFSRFGAKVEIHTHGELQSRRIRRSSERNVQDLDVPELLDGVGSFS